MLEKFSTMSVIALFIILLAIAGLGGGLAKINALYEFSFVTVFPSLTGCLPFLMVIAAVGILAAVFFQKVRVGMGVKLTFVFAAFFQYTFRSFSKSLEWMKTISIFKYWNYSSVKIDNLFKTRDFVILAVLAIVLIISGIWVFENKDIPT
jgi:hypothetical protein